MSIKELLNTGITTFQTNYNLETIRNYLHSSEHNQLSNLFEYDMAWVLNHPTLKSLLDDFLVNYHLSSFSSNCIRDINTNQVWHQDYPYHNINYNDDVSLQVILAVDDFTEANGATNFTDRILTCEAGTMIVFNSRLIHKQGINKTGIPRAAILANFCKKGITPKDRFQTITFPFEYENDIVVFKK